MSRPNGSKKKQGSADTNKQQAWRLSLGASVTSDGVHFRLWATKPKLIEVLLQDGTTHRLNRDDAGYWSGLVPQATTGMTVEMASRAGATKSM